MGEWVRKDGEALKTTDAMLEYILTLLDGIKTLEAELDLYRRIVPVGNGEAHHVGLGS